VSAPAQSFTPREIVSELDRYIVGQNKAKRAVAIALRNRFRRQRVALDLRSEITPKNIIMIGPTGVGKTEIARRLAKLAQAPFVKVEASKFTEVGYVGRDVESMIRDLVEQAIDLVRREEISEVQIRAAQLAEERLIRLLARPVTSSEPKAAPQSFGPFTFSMPKAEPEREVPAAEAAEIRGRLRAGELDDRMVEIDVEDQGGMPLVSLLGGAGMGDLEQKLGDMFGGMPGMKGKTRKRNVRVSDAKALLEAQEAERLIDMDKVKRLAVERTEQSGIVFLDEIDKIASRRGGVGGGPDVSREGVQRDLLPIVEGSTVSTKFGPVRTDHILFVAAGAFHVSKVSDLIPELQGRFPVRVELDSLTKADFVRILTEPKNALTHQYQALLETEGVRLTFTEDGIEALAAYAAEANERAENIGARRLHTIMEALLDDLSFRASELSERDVTFDAQKVRATLDPIVSNEDLARYIL